MSISSFLVKYNLYSSNVVFFGSIVVCCLCLPGDCEYRDPDQYHQQPQLLHSYGYDHDELEVNSSSLYSTIYKTDFLTARLLCSTRILRTV